MNRFQTVAAVALLACYWSCSHLFASTEAPAPIAKSQSPNRSLAVFIVASSTNAERRLALMSLENKAVLADVLLSMTAPAAGQSSIKASVLWKQDSTGVAVSFSDRTNSVIFACVKVSGDRFKWLDMKVAEGPNLGVLGRPRSDFARVEDTPTRWTDETDHTPRMVWVRSRFCDKTGQRYTVEQEFSITPTGEIGWK